MEFLDLEGKEEKDIVFDVFDLNKLQRQIFEEIEDTQMTVQEIADQVDRNRSTVQRALQEMLDKDVIMREGKTDKTVYYVYTTLPLDQLQELTLRVVEEWHEEIEERMS
jgi:predicted transcriptional regulator